MSSAVASSNSNRVEINADKMGPGKRQKFVKLAERRTKNAIRAIRIIGKLGNKSHYDYDDGDVKKIANALTKEVENLRSRMSSSGGKDEVEFRLS